jgi:hypothetical protein
MGKGLSPLQRDVLAVLENYPAFEQLNDFRAWARPQDILARLEREPTKSNRAALSRTLRRLYVRRLVAKSLGGSCNAGNSFRYVRIADRKKAGIAGGRQ